MQQSDKRSEYHSTLTQQANGHVNIIASPGTCVSSIENWDLSFLDTRPTSDAAVLLDVSGQRSLLNDMSHNGTGTSCHSYHNVDVHGYHNVDIHSYQNVDFRAQCQPNTIHEFRSPAEIGECENGFLLPITFGAVLHPSRLSSSEIGDKPSQTFIADEEASKLRNSLATVVKKACPRPSLVNPGGPPCSPLARSSQSNTLNYPLECNNFSRSSNSSHPRSPRWASTDKGPILPGFRSTSCVSDHFRRSVTVHSPDHFYDEIHADFFGDSDVFDDVQSPMMTSSRDTVSALRVGQPAVLWESLYNIGTSCSSPSVDTKSKAGNGISSENIYPHSRKPSSIESSGGGSADSGLSSSSCSDVFGCSKPSPNFSFSSELQTDTLSDTGSTIGHPDIRVINVSEKSGCNGLDSSCGNCSSTRAGSNVARSGALAGMSDPTLHTTSPMTSPITSQITLQTTSDIGSHTTSHLTSPITSHGTSKIISQLTSQCSVFSQRVSPTSEVTIESDNVRRLELINYRLTVCRFYFGRLTADEARTLLAPTPVGTYLLRDSSDVRFKYSISVQTTRGPTSIRVGYDAGRFYLDSKPDQLNSIPRFDCALALVRFYARLSAPNRVRLPSTECGDVVSQQQHRDGPVMLLKAYEHAGVASLLHLCRRTINGRLDGRSPSRLCLVPSLKGYLNEYPYDF